MAISKHDKQALADLFIHMGVPLVVSMQTVESWSGADGEDLKTRTEKLSKLLTVAVEFATKITKKMEIRDAYTLENVRGKIIRIVTPIIGDSYVRDGQIPSENDLSELTDLFDVLISFAASVSPADEKGSKATKMATMVEACDPLLAAIRDNDFGMGGNEAFHESVAGIKGRAEQLAPQLGLDSAIESGLFKSIVTIYVSCYKFVGERGGKLQDVWKECDERLAIIQGLTGYVSEKTGIIVPSTDAKPVITKTTPVEKEEAPKAELKTQQNKEKETDKDEGDDDGDFNPMSFFSANG